MKFKQYAYLVVRRIKWLIDIVKSYTYSIFDERNHLKQYSKDINFKHE